MIDDANWEFFDANGYVLLKGVLEGEHLRRIQDAYDEVWDAEGPPCNQHKLLKHRTFIDLVEHQPIVEQHRAIFGSQTQLLQYDLLRQGGVTTDRRGAGIGISPSRESFLCRSTPSSTWTR